MNKDDFLKLMNFPKEWLEYELYPDELFSAQLEFYKPGDEAGAEHDRNGAFHWWLKRKPTANQLHLLLKLSCLDPDKAMGADVRRHIEKAITEYLPVLILHADCTKDEYRALGEEWAKRDDVSLDLSLINEYRHIKKIAHFALLSPDRDFSNAVLSELAEKTHISNNLLEKMFKVGDQACKESIALRKNLSLSLKKKCLSAALIHRPDIDP